MNKKSKAILEKYLPLPGKIKSEEDLKSFRAKVSTNKYIVTKRVVNGSVVTQIYDRENKEYVEDTVVNTTSLNQKAVATPAVDGMKTLTTENDELKAKLIAVKALADAKVKFATEGIETLTVDELKIIALEDGKDIKGLKKPELIKLIKGDE